MELTAAMAIAATALDPVGGGWWQTRTLIQGASTATIDLRCIARAGEWTRAVLPPAILADCEPPGRDLGGSVPCGRGGRLSVNGTAGSDRFDIVARRSGPIGAHPGAVAVLHIEGRRVAQTCPSSTSSKDLQND